jgi:hypothetical protein
MDLLGVMEEYKCPLYDPQVQSVMMKWVNKLLFQLHNIKFIKYFSWFS